MRTRLGESEVWSSEARAEAYVDVRAWRLGCAGRVYLVLLFLALGCFAGRGDLNRQAQGAEAVKIQEG